MIAKAMDRRIDFSLILPCYNESAVFDGSTEKIISVLKRCGLIYEIIFVDDYSSDNTTDLIWNFCKKNPECRVIYHTKNTGRGKTVTDGILDAQGTVVGYIDIDCEVSPVYIPECIDYVLNKKADVVVGKRIYRTTIFSLMREVFSIGYQYLSSCMIGTGKIDTESGYKFFDRKKIIPILKLTQHPHWFWDTEVIAWSQRKGLKVVEVPVLFLRRFDKKSSVNVIQDSWDYIVSLWKFRNRLNSERNR